MSDQPNQEQPVVDIIVRVDTRTGQVSGTVFGGQIEPKLIYEALDVYRRHLQEQELEAYKQAVKELSMSKEADDAR